MPKRSTLRLTTRSVATLPVTGKDAVYWDRDLAGFGVRVQRNGRKVYVVQSRGPAGLKRVTLGPFAGMAIDVRRREAATIIDRIKRGLDPIPPEPDPDPTVADLAARCMRAYVKVHCKPKTEKLYRTAIDRHIVPGLCCKLGEGAMRNQGASCSPYDSALARRSCSHAMASVRAHGPRPKARSTIRASPTMPPWRANIPAWPLRSARITSKPLIVA